MKKAESVSPGSQADPGKRPPLSERKLKANRENAQKSTGPRTSRGKSYSSRNAWKHGLFSTSLVIDFAMAGESMQKYDDLWCDIYTELQPSGRLEEIEVERIVDCYWRLQRVRRYERSLVFKACLPRMTRVLGPENPANALNEAETPVLLELHNIVASVNIPGMDPEEVKKRVEALGPRCKELWETTEEAAQKTFRRMESLHPETYGRLDAVGARILAASRVGEIIIRISLTQALRTANTKEMILAEAVLPEHEDMDKILRSETSIERALKCAYGRLEWLQQRRQLPPALTAI